MDTHVFLRAGERGHEGEERVRASIQLTHAYVRWHTCAGLELCCAFESSCQTWQRKFNGPGCGLFRSCMNTSTSTTASTNTSSSTSMSSSTAAAAAAAAGGEEGREGGPVKDAQERAAGQGFMHEISCRTHAQPSDFRPPTLPSSFPPPPGFPFPMSECGWWRSSII